MTHSMIRVSPLSGARHGNGKSQEGKWGWPRGRPHNFWASACYYVKPWDDKKLRIGDWVRDNKGERGRGRVIKLWPFGVDVDWERYETSFLGYHWLDKIIPPSERVATELEEFEVAEEAPARDELDALERFERPALWQRTRGRTHVGDRGEEILEVRQDGEVVRTLGVPRPENLYPTRFSEA